MQLQALFQKEEVSESVLELNISKIVEEIENYLEEIRNLTKLGFNFSIKDNKFNITQDAISMAGAALIFGNIGINLALPGSGIMKIALVTGLLGTLVYKYLSKNNGIFKERLLAIQEKTNNLNALIKNEKFRIALIVNIEKDFNTLEEKFETKPETLSMVKKKRVEVVNKLKEMLVEEDLSKINNLLNVLINIKEIEEQTQKLLKLDNLNQAVISELQGGVSESPEENEVTERIKALL